MLAGRLCDVAPGPPWWTYSGTLAQGALLGLNRESASLVQSHFLLAPSCLGTVLGGPASWLWLLGPARSKPLSPSGKPAPPWAPAPGCPQHCPPVGEFLMDMES